jgi:GTPase SAR1 family protein
VHGIAGVGKSTLLEAFAHEARSRGETVVVIDCRSIEPTERGFLDSLGSAVGGAPASAEEAAERLAGLGERVVLVLDTYEVLRLLDSWVRLVFAPALRDNTRLVLAGREPPVANWYATPGWSELVRSVRLRSE